MEQLIRVFIADASAEYMRLLRAALEQEPDFLVAGCAHRGDEALRLLPESGADLLICDLLLPGLDGLSLLHRLKEADALPRTLVVSGFYNDRIARMVSAAADDYLPKPISASALLRHARELMFGRGRAFVCGYDLLLGRLLSECGVQPHLNGFLYLRDGILRALDDRGALRGITKSLYREIGRSFGTSGVCVERSMRTAIGLAWQRITPEQRSAVFGRSFDAFPQAPSNLAFLSAMTEFVEAYCAREERFG